MEKHFSVEANRTRRAQVRAEERRFEEMYRGTGRTTRQIQAAPKGAIFVWVNSGSIQYARDLAASLGRSDLTIVSPSWLEERRFMGLELTGLIADHALELNSRLMEVYRQAHFRVRSVA